MALLTFIRPDTKIDFVKARFMGFALSAFIILGSFVAYFVNDLNYGIDFKGGMLIEIRSSEPVELSDLRARLNNLGLGDVKLQEFGEESDIMIRVERQKGGEKEQNMALDKIKAELGESVSYRRIDTVGPKVSEDLKRNGSIAIGLALLAMLVYIWLRFEWQFGLTAVIGLIHDCIAVFGLYALIGLEFNETAIIAILTTLGYSINDTVVIFDRIRENLRKFKKRPIADIINQSVNDTLSRTILTSFTTLLALVALYFLGGNVIATFSLPIIVGIIVGTYSSFGLVSPLLLYINVGGDERESGI